MRTAKIVFWISTSLLSLQMLMAAGMYFFNNAEVHKSFVTLGYPTYLIYPLAIAKILGVIVILTNFSQVLKEWAYTGFFFNFILGVAAHFAVGDGQQWGAVVALILLFTSYFSGKSIRC